MRAILVDWLVQVHSKFRLLQETLYMCVAIMDRFLQVRDFMQLSELCIYALPRCGASEEKTKSQLDAKELQVLEKEVVQVCQTSGDADQYWAFLLGQPAEKCSGEMLPCRNHSLEEINHQMV